ncbi:MAG: glycosyltransferase family 39 protein [Aquabacterium sp.]
MATSASHPGMNSPARSDALVAIGLFVAMLLLNHVVGVYGLRGAPLMGDALDYFDRAVQLLQGADNGKAHYWPPGGPYVLEVLFRLTGRADAMWAQVLMSGMSALTTAVAFLLASRVSGQRKVAWMAALFYGLSPTTLWMARQSESHTFCAMWVALAALFAVRYVQRHGYLNLLLAALSLGMLVLTRPGSALLALALAALPMLLAALRQRTDVHLSWPHALLQSLMVGVAMLAMLWPTLQFNHARGAGWVLSTNNERNFFLGNNPYTHPYKTGHMAQRELASLPPDVQAYLKRHYQAADPRAAMLQSSKDYILQEPVQFIRRCVNRFANFWTFDYEQGRRLQMFLEPHGRVAVAPMALQAVCSVALVALMWLGLPVLLKAGQGAWALSALFVCLLYQAPHVVAFSSPVYRSGLGPLICLLAAWGLVLARSGLLREEVGAVSAMGWRRKVYTVVVLIGLLAINAQAAYYLVKLR